MNKRIEELAQCNERILNFFQTGPVQRAAIEQFSELIVRECAALCDQATTENRLTRSALTENLTTITEELILSGAMAQSEKLSVRIKQHFGVK
jgi:hypothetical protein